MFSKAVIQRFLSTIIYKFADFQNLGILSNVNCLKKIYASTTVLQFCIVVSKSASLLIYHNWTSITISLGVKPYRTQARGDTISQCLLCPLWSLWASCEQARAKPKIDNTLGLLPLICSFLCSGAPSMINYLCSTAVKSVSFKHFIW